MKSIFVAAAAAALLAGCANSGSSYNATPQAKAAYAAPTAQKAASIRTTARGAFVGDGSHVSSGTAEVFRQNKQWFIRLGPDFNLDGGPDPKVGLGNKARGGYQPGTILGKLTSFQGEQVYALAPGLDIGDYDQVYIWCERFSVPLAHANLTLL